MIRNLIRKIDQRLPARDRSESTEKGQSIIILAFAFLGLLAMLGLALDLGLVYIERVRLRRAIDAAVLAGVTELPFESQSYQRALQYLDDNGYDVYADSGTDYSGNVDVYFMGCWPNPANPKFNPDTPTAITPGSPAVVEDPPSKTTIILDTRRFQADDTEPCDSDEKIFGVANKLAITGTVRVRMNFMQFFGFAYVPVNDQGIAQNVTSLDVAVVFDRSGSMEFDTVCYDCWTPGGGPASEYPNTGTFHPIPFDASQNAAPNNVTDKNLCSPSTSAYVSGGRRYLVLEAELYYQANTDWENRGQGQGLWAMQRNGTGASSVDGTGTYVSHHPFTRFVQWDNPGSGDVGQFYDLADVGNLSPMLQYVFTPDWDGRAYIWLRVQPGPTVFARNDSGNPDRNTIYWQLTGPALDTTVRVNTNAPAGGGANYGGATLDNWTWIRLNDAAGDDVVKDNPHQLRVWAGSVGYDIDKIVVTDSPGNPPGALSQNEGQGPAATEGSAYGDTTNAAINSWACDVCNPVFGRTVDPTMCSAYVGVLTLTNHLANDLFSDQLPIRAAKEAVKNFVKRLDPKFDQVGFVSYSDNVSISELECLKRHGPACYQNPNPISYTATLAEIENVDAAGNTDLALGMREGIEVLGINATGGGVFNTKCDGTPGSHCSRGGSAKRILVIMTDGVPNRNPGNGCDAEDFYPNNTGVPDLDAAADCVIFYAREADLAGITLYAIGVGRGADQELLEYAAEEVGSGQFFYAPDPSFLDGIFNAILQNIYVRLIS